MHCPRFIHEIAVARAAFEFLSSEMGLEAYTKKYADGLSELYGEIGVELIQDPAEQILQFLAEIEAGEQAVDLLAGFMHFRLYYEGVGRPRKMKPLFGSIEDGVKSPEINAAETGKAFRAYVFRQRSNTVPVMPSGWRLEDDQHLPNFNTLVEKAVSVLDIL